MPSKQIYFTEQNYIRLKAEDNASQLINNLLNEHYKEELISPENLEAIKKRLEQDKIEAEKRINKELEKVNREYIQIKKKAEKLKSEEEKKEQKSKDKYSTINKNLSELLEREATKEETEDYIQKLEDKEVSNMFVYANEIRKREGKREYGEE